MNKFHLAPGKKKTRRRDVLKRQRVACDSFECGRSVSLSLARASVLCTHKLRCCFHDGDDTRRDEGVDGEDNARRKCCESRFSFLVSVCRKEFLYSTASLFVKFTKKRVAGVYGFFFAGQRRNLQSVFRR